jgi:hypothetical protein
MKNLALEVLGKSCGDCTKCCDGWLTANINGHEMFEGKPCVFVKQGGCSIYESRPEDPCVNFKCEWLINPYLDESMKPTNSNIIIMRRNIDGISYLVARYAGENVSANDLSKVIDYCQKNSKNLLWEMSEARGWIGSDDFCQRMSTMNF